MRWQRGKGDNRGVIDRRGGGGRGAVAGVGGGLGLVGVIIVVAIQLLGGQNLNLPPGFETGLTTQGGEPIPPGQDPDKDLRDFSAYVFNDVQDMWAKIDQGLRARRARALQRLDLDRRVRDRLGGRRAVLLPGRPARVPGPVLLQADGAPAERAGRLRVGVRDRPRGRPPRAEPRRDLRAGPAAAEREPRRRPTSCRSSWSCRPTATPGCGRAASSSSSRRATSRRR